MTGLVYTVTVGLHPTGSCSTQNFALTEDTPVTTNYVLIDYESVQTKSLEQLTHEHFEVIVFVGKSQAKVPVELAQSVQPFGARAQYLKISGHGPNALDFHIAYYIGHLAAAEPSAKFHIVSKDKGFEPLIQHLRLNNISARRITTIGNILGKPSKSKLSQERIAVILTKLQRLKAAKPRTIKTLSSTIAFWFQNHLPAQEISSLIQSLVSRGYVQIAGAKITYRLPANSQRKS